MTDTGTSKGVSGSGSGRLANLSTVPDSAPGPAGHNLRRAAAIDEAAFLRRRRPTLGSTADSDDWSPSARRRNSFFSQDARNILDPGLDDGPTKESHASSRWETLPLVFALFPAIAGVFFQGGSAVATDLILLTFGGLFLHWAVTQPWSWYISAQQIRAAEEHMGDIALEASDDSEENEGARQQQEEGSEAGDAISHREQKARERQRQARDTALKQLYRHETWALISCFVSPLAGAYILHQIRNQLTRPAEGLVSNYNLTIFVVISVVRPLQQIIKLVRSRTLHLQRIVHANPYRDPSSPTTTPTPSPQLDHLIRRIEELETRASDMSTSSEQNGPESRALKRADARRERDAIERDVRAQIQPEMDTLARVLRRSRRDLVQMGAHIDEAHRHMSQRLDDAYSLASIAVARNESFLGWLFSWIPWLLNSAASSVLVFLMLPLRQARHLFGGRGGQVVANSGKSHKMRSGRAAVGSKRKI